MRLYLGMLSVPTLAFVYTLLSSLEVGHGIGNRMLREWFQHSGETMSRHFNAVLKAILSLRNDYMKLPNNDVGVHEKIHSDPKFYPLFKARRAGGGN
ncbi:hypothetical protein Taro_046127 [Colocasia esculenta]|uniref:DUF8040 domain-containing protein n=1 Tax=Colocasia esculenta TaxID=4460 RepID=A0A843X5Q4_COLES|nr:hypothetical protein [Colocasia esculenta]